MLSKSKPNDGGDDELEDNREVTDSSDLDTEGLSSHEIDCNSTNEGKLQLGLEAIGLQIGEPANNATFPPPLTHHRQTSSKDEDLDYYLTTQLKSVGVDTVKMLPQGKKPSLNPAAAVFSPGQPCQPDTASTTSRVSSGTATGLGNIPAGGTSGRLYTSQKGRSNLSGTSFNDHRRDPTYAENPNPAFLHGPRLIPGRSTGRSVMEESARFDATGPNPDNIPLYGSLHGMHFHPSTGTFTGDGPPRSTPLRSDGKGPCTPAMMTPKDPTANGRLVSDQLHVQTRAFVDRSMETFGANGNVQVMYFGKPEGRIAEREEDEEQFKIIAAAKEESKKKLEEENLKNMVREKLEEKHFKIVTGAKERVKDELGGKEKEKEAVGGAGYAEPSLTKDDVKVRDFMYEPIKEKKKVNFGTKKPPTMAEKLEMHFAKDL